MLTPVEYEQVRESIGSRRDVAKMLGVDIRTIQRRERAEIAITFEATRALFCLAALNRLRQLIVTVTDNNGIKKELNALAGLLEAH